MPQGVYTRIQIQSLRQTLDTILKDEAAPSPIVRERVARIAVRIADERNVF